MVRNSINRLAFTMIELIFAIVIIGITVISLPMMSQLTAKGIEDSIVQEAIFAASAELMGATSGYWDGNSMQDSTTSHLSRVIDISNDCNTTTDLRPGHINQPLHRRCLDNKSTTASNSGAGTLDAAAHGDQYIFINTTTDKSGYKETYKSNVSVNISGNVKTITAIVKKSNGTPITTLYTQSANIGEIDYYNRRF